MIPAVPDLALGCLDRLAALGDYTYNWSLGEQHRWQSPRWLTHDEMADTLAAMRADGPSGDIYARRHPRPETP